MTDAASSNGPRRPARSRVALNPIQWYSVKENPTDPSSPRIWRLNDLSFRDLYPEILAQVRSAGFDSVMLNVLETQSLREYEGMVLDAGLSLAPGYATIDLPENDAPRGTAQRARWFDGVRRKAEESTYFGLDTIFLSPELTRRIDSPRATTAAAVGAAFDADRLERLTALIDAASEVLAVEGVRAGLHNHVGTWIETVEEIDYVLASIPPQRLGASFDIGHLEWVGADSAEVVARHADRLLDLHIKDIDTDVARRSRATPAPYSWAPRHGLFREPGDGDVDLERVLDALPPDFGGWVIIEVDSTDLAPEVSARRCAQWADRVFASA